MRIKSFRAESAREALMLVKSEMGEDAVILDTRSVRTGGLLGLGAREMVEVMAAVDEPEAPCRHSSVQAEHQLEHSPDTSALTVINDLRREVLELKSLVTAGAAQDADADDPALRRLEELGFDTRLLRLRIPAIAAAQTDAQLTEMLASALEGRTAPPAGSPRSVVALVGPTGVGKTTTIAKLAARLALQERRSAALVTCDTFRIGAVAQIRVYSDILKLPLEIVASPEEMKLAVAKHADKDVILIDTIGRSHRNAAHLRELQTLLAPARPTEVHLVVSAASSPDCQAETLESFSVLSPNRLVISKTDEACRRGCAVNLPLASGLPVSCLTNGQNVPDDIRIASPDLLARVAMGVED